MVVSLKISEWLNSHNRGDVEFYSPESASDGINEVLVTKLETGRTHTGAIGRRSLKLAKGRQIRLRLYAHLVSDNDAPLLEVVSRFRRPRAKRLWPELGSMAQLVKQRRHRNARPSACAKEVPPIALHPRVKAQGRMPGNRKQGQVTPTSLNHPSIARQGQVTELHVA